jgi:hypothetical protein
MILQELTRDIELHGFYRTAYAKRHIATKPFIVSVVRTAISSGCWTVIEETDSHIYATVWDVGRLRGDRLSRAAAVESSAK